MELAQAWAVLGEPDRSAELLRHRMEAAVAVGDDPDTIEACELALLKLCRRQRTTAYSSSVYRLSQQGSPRTRSKAWLVRDPRRRSAAEFSRGGGQLVSLVALQDTKSLASLDSPGTHPVGLGDGGGRRQRSPSSYPDLREASTNLDGGGPGASHDFGPDDELRLGRELRLPPGALGRAAVSVAELTALRFPERAVPRLVEATGSCVRPETSWGPRRRRCSRPCGGPLS